MEYIATIVFYEYLRWLYAQTLLTSIFTVSLVGVTAATLVEFALALARRFAR